MSAEFFLEIFQEEIPASMQKNASQQLRTAFVQKFSDAHLQYQSIVTYVTPLRLVVLVQGLQEQQPDQVIEKKGPLLSAPEKAISGFLRSNGLSSITECSRLETPKGEALLLQNTIAGLPTKDLLPRFISQILNNFSWPNSMRFSDQNFRWVRPLRQLAGVFDGQSLEGNIALGNRTLPFSQEICIEREPSRMAPLPNNFTAYRLILEKAEIILDAEERRENIRVGIAAIEQKYQCRWHEDTALLSEVSGLLERVNILAGTIDDHFMKLPDMVLRLTLRSHQKYFVFKSLNSEDLAPVFAISTTKSTAQAQQIVLNGNKRVLRARLQDAEFFLTQDLRIPLLQHAEKLKHLRFVEGLGSLYDKAMRIAHLLTLAPINLCKSDAEKLALLAKADLVSEMVGEFAELQGFMGSYYAQEQDENPKLVQAIARQYSPKGPSDTLPDSLLGCALAMMDKIDTVAGFAHRQSLPSGSGDPFAIRRAMLGAIRIARAQSWLEDFPDLFRQALSGFGDADNDSYSALYAFYRARMFQYLRDQKIDAHVAQAALESNFADFPALAQALQEFLTTDEGAHLRTTYMRASGILKQNEGMTEISSLPEDLLEDADIQLWHTVQRVTNALSSETISLHDRFTLLSTLSQPLNFFFDTVLINAEDTAIRDARLNILYKVVVQMQRVAKFDRLISG